MAALLAALKSVMARLVRSADALLLRSSCPLLQRLAMVRALIGMR